jgi:hypothetical protein
MFLGLIATEISYEILMENEELAKKVVFVFLLHQILLA